MGEKRICIEPSTKFNFDIFHSKLNASLEKKLNQDDVINFLLKLGNTYLEKIDESLKPQISSSEKTEVIG